jgi:hypothetical protein
VSRHSVSRYQPEPEPPLPPARPVLDRVLQLALALAVVGIVVVATLGVRNTYAGAVPSASATVGTCHSFLTVEEFYTTSDVSPAVPCDGPHQTEVVAVRTYAGATAGQQQRPGLEVLGAMSRGLCKAAELRTYLGARERDDYVALQQVIRWPTPGEWAGGAREYRCELMLARSVDGGTPTLFTPAREVLAGSTGSAEYRHCYDSTTAQDVSCDRPHTGEYVNAFLPAPAANTPQGLTLTAWAQNACAALVKEYTGGRPGVRVDAVRVGYATTSTGACLAVPAGGRVVGTVAPGDGS